MKKPKLEMKPELNTPTESAKSDANTPLGSPAMNLKVISISASISEASSQNGGSIETSSTTSSDGTSEIEVLLEEIEKFLETEKLEQHLVELEEEIAGEASDVCIGVSRSNSRESFDLHIDSILVGKDMEKHHSI